MDRVRKRLAALEAHADQMPLTAVERVRRVANLFRRVAVGQRVEGNDKQAAKFERWADGADQTTANGEGESAAALEVLRKVRAPQ